MKEKLRSFLKKENLILMILAGVLLLIISTPAGKGGKKEQETADLTQKTVVAEKEESEEDVFRKKLQKELEELLSQVDGAGEVKVMLFFKESSEMVVEKDVKKDQKQTGESGLSTANKVASEMMLEENTVQGKDKEPFVVKKIYPKIEGVVVLAGGVGTGRVRSDLTEAVQALLGLEAHKIKVLKLGHIKSTK